MSSTIFSEIEELIIRRKVILEELRKFESKYRLSSDEFYEKWSKGLLPEPDDPETHGDFIIWYGLLEELRRIEKNYLSIFRCVYGV